MVRQKLPSSEAQQLDCLGKLVFNHYWEWGASDEYAAPDRFDGFRNEPAARRGNNGTEASWSILRTLPEECYGDRNCPEPSTAFYSKLVYVRRVDSYLDSCLGWKNRRISLHAVWQPSIVNRITPVAKMVSKTDFEQSVLFMFSDVERELQLAKAKPEVATSLGITPGGGNFLAALGLLCYTEFGGKLRFNCKKPNGLDFASENFNRFFDTLGLPYANFRASHNVYDIFRCGLAHEYYAKKHCTIYMFGASQQPGIGVDTNGKYWFAVENYALDLKAAFRDLEGQLFGATHERA